MPKVLDGITENGRCLIQTLAVADNRKSITILQPYVRPAGHGKIPALDSGNQHSIGRVERQFPE